MNKWKKNLMAAAVLLVVCTGIYMNWLYTNDQQVTSLTETLDAQKVLSTEGLLLNTDKEGGNEPAGTPSPITLRRCAFLARRPGTAP